MLIEMTFWWYQDGWRTFALKLKAMFSSVADFFSMSSLVRTLFQPFRQISAETASAESSLDLKFRMFLDRLISRFIGFFMRLILLIIGTIIILLGGGLGLVLLILWPFLPLLPVVGIVLSVMGVMI